MTSLTRSLTWMWTSMSMTYLTIQMANRTFHICVLFIQRKICVGVRVEAPRGRLCPKSALVGQQTRDVLLHVLTQARHGNRPGIAVCVASPLLTMFLLPSLWPRLQVHEVHPVPLPNYLGLAFRPSCPRLHLPLRRTLMQALSTSSVCWRRLVNYLYKSSRKR